MRKLFAILCALCLACTAAAASAEIIRPDTPETLTSLIGGKSFSARVTGLDSTGEDEDTKFRIISKQRRMCFARQTIPTRVPEEAL